METCLYCNKSEKNYKPSKSVDFVCGSCILKFLQMDKIKLEALHKKYTAKKQENQLKALRFFYR